MSYYPVGETPPLTPVRTFIGPPFAYRANDGEPTMDQDKAIEEWAAAGRGSVLEAVLTRHIAPEEGNRD